jgi:hypothetical protein
LWGGGGGAGVRVYFVKKTQYRLIPVLTFLKYRYYTGPGIENSIPNWKTLTTALARRSSQPICDCDHEMYY